MTRAYDLGTSKNESKRRCKGDVKTSSGKKVFKSVLWSRSKPDNPCAPGKQYRYHLVSSI